MAERTSAAGFTRDVLPRQVRRETLPKPTVDGGETTKPDERTGILFLDGWPGWRTALMSVAIALALVLFGLGLCALAEAMG